MKEEVIADRLTLSWLLILLCPLLLLHSANASLLFPTAIAGSFSVPDDVGGAYVPDDTENNPKRKFKKAVNKLRDCADYQDQGHGKNGNYTIYVGPQKIPLRVFCDMTTDGGGWTIFQRRNEGLLSFRKDWKAYAYGFGNLGGEFWLGNAPLSLVVQQQEYSLRVDMQDYKGLSRYAEYKTFQLKGPESDYAMIIDGYTGDAGNSMPLNMEQKFSTFDRDNDADYSWGGSHCARLKKGGWWYHDCGDANLNGFYHRGGQYKGGEADGVFWQSWHGIWYSLRSTELKIRPMRYYNHNQWAFRDRRQHHH